MSHTIDSTDDLQKKQKMTISARRRWRKAMKQAAQDDILDAYVTQANSQAATGVPDLPSSELAVDGSRADDGISKATSKISLNVEEAKEAKEAKEEVQGDSGASKMANPLAEKWPRVTEEVSDQTQHEHVGTLTDNVHGSPEMMESSRPADINPPDILQAIPSQTHATSSASDGHTTSIAESSRPRPSQIIPTDVRPQSTRSERQSPVLEPVSVEQPLDNLLVMIRQQREALLEGPQITLCIGDIVINDIPRRAALAASETLNRFFTKHPSTSIHRFVKGQMDPQAVRQLLVLWMQATCREFEAFPVPFQPTFHHDMALLRASRYLGMEKYTSHISQAYMDYFKTALPTYEELAIVEQNATHKGDLLWSRLVNHLCYLRQSGNIPDPDDFEAFLAKHPKLNQAMKKASYFFSNRAKANRTRHDVWNRQRKRGNEQSA